jgi:hypothetical protein
MTSVQRAVLPLALLAGAAATTAAPQGVVRGLVYDSLLHAPLSGAEIWVRGTERRTFSDAEGRFRFDAIAPGRYVIAATHAGLDSAGLYTLVAPVVVAGGDTARVTLATPSLGTLWRRRCATEVGSGSDSGVVFGVVQDAATGAHLAGATLIASWVRLVQTDPVNVRMDDRAARVRSDSLGAYYACGVTTDAMLGLRAYAGTDSTGLIDVRLGPRAVARQDLTVALATPRSTAGRPLATLRGSAVSDDGRPLVGGRVSVREAGATVINADGSFLLSRLPAGTQWVSVQAIARAPVGQAVDLRGGDTAALSVTLGAVPVTLAPVRVTAAQRSRSLAEFEERRRMGLGYTRTAAELAQIKTMRGVFSGVPSVTLGRSRANADFIILLPSPSAGGRAACVAALFIDGFRSTYDQLSAFLPSDLVGVEVYARPSLAPIQYQSVSSGCGVVLVWTNYAEGR